MAKLSVSERLSRKKAALAKAKEQLATTQAKITTLNKEIAELENFEILALTRDLNMPSHELKSLLQELITKNKQQNSEN